MKITQVTLAFTLLAATNAAKKPSGVRRRQLQDDSFSMPAAIEEVEDLANCWPGSNEQAAWHRDTSMDWANGICKFHVDCESTSYSSEKECCDGAYANQWSKACLKNMPDYEEIAESVEPADEATDVEYVCDQPEAWHRDTSMGWANGVCVFNVDCEETSYASEGECCAGAYANQWSEACFKNMPKPPTPSPIAEGATLDVWYADWATPFEAAACTNAAPLPRGEATYPTMMECCNDVYAAQTSGMCVATAVANSAAEAVGGALDDLGGMLGFTEEEESP